LPTSERALAIRARWALPWIFFLMGLTSMAWVPRIPEIKSSLGLSDGEFGVVLVSSSVGAIIGAQLAGRLIQRFGSRNLMRFAQTTLPLGVLVMGLAPNVYVLALGLFFMGLGSAAMDMKTVVIMLNAHSTTSYCQGTLVHRSTHGSLLLDHY
jgi:MFS family permease